MVRESGPTNRESGQFSALIVFNYIYLTTKAVNISEGWTRCGDVDQLIVSKHCVGNVK